MADTSADEPRCEIVYDDPGSVTDIRKRFGAMTKPSFARPRALRVVVRLMIYLHRKETM